MAEGKHSEAESIGRGSDLHPWHRSPSPPPKARAGRHPLDPKAESN